MNTVKTTLLLGLMTGMMLAVGSFFGNGGILFAFVLAAVMNLGTYWFSDKIVLKMYRAQPAEPGEYPELHSMVETLCQRAGIPKPALYVLPSDAANAFATGRNPEHAAVAVTLGAMRLLDRDELEGVVAHELAHVKNRDTLISAVAATIAGAITMIARFVGYAAMFGGLGGRDRQGGALGALAMMIVAPLAAILVQMAISRTREYKADATGARFVGHPHGLASALQKLERAGRARPAEATPATSHMFIVKPLSGGIAAMFSTHPPTEERVRRLRELASA